VDCVRICLWVILFGLVLQQCGIAGMLSVTSLGWLTRWWYARAPLGTCVYIFICFPFSTLGLDFVFMYFLILITSYCGVFAQSKNCGAREIAVAR
jgi:hypothetical protein